MELVDEGVAGGVVGGDVVVFEELVASAVATHLVAFFDDTFLAGAGVALASGRVDWSALGVVDEGS